MGRSMWEKEHEFQQDNAPIHVSKATRAFFQESNMQVMDWPAYSPDLNPIENVWGLLSRSIYGSGRQYDSEKDLKEAIWSAWRHLDENIIKTLIFSMENRCIDVISKKGGITSYWNIILFGFNKNFLPNHWNLCICLKTVLIIFLCKKNLSLILNQNE